MKRVVVLTLGLLTASLSPFPSLAGGSCGGGGWHGGGGGWYGGGCGSSFSFGIGFSGYYPAGGWGYGYPSYAVSYAPVIYPQPAYVYYAPQPPRPVTSVTVASAPVVRTTTHTVISRTSVPASPSTTPAPPSAEIVAAASSQTAASGVVGKGTWVLDPQPYRYVPMNSARAGGYQLTEQAANVVSSPALPR